TPRRKRAILTALFVIFFDITLALAGYFGIGLVIEQWDIARMVVLGVGGLLVVLIGVSLLRAKEVTQERANMSVPIPRLVSMAAIVTWLNPQAIIDVTMLLGSSKASLGEGEGLVFLLGVIAASCLWFLGLSTAISVFSSKFTPAVVRRINVVCGIVIILYGLRLLFSFVLLLV
ncbi:MAG: LysE family transporter, partial [Coriobacteriales bacterium]|nr:LysE family transporter [Coriobacteriales bacterium]